MGRFLLTCAAMAHPGLLTRALQVVGCPLDDCANREGNLWLKPAWPGSVHPTSGGPLLARPSLVPGYWRHLLLGLAFAATLASIPCTP